jgi:hypothetical protein
MYTPASDEKLTLVMVYTRDSMIRAEVVTKDNARVSTWLRTPGAPRYLHLLKAHVIQFSGAGVKSASHSELFLPIGQVIAFHLAPPAADGMDYESDEKNRMMQTINVIVGTFTFKGELRISTQGTVSSYLEVSKIAWMSVYNAEISNPSLPQMPPIKVPLAIFAPEMVSYGLSE